MFPSVFADADSAGLMEILYRNWPLLRAPFLAFVAIYLLLPKGRRGTPLWGGMFAGLALLLGAWVFVRNETVWEETLLFYAFSGLAIGSGVMMIAQSNPVHAALSFALVVLSTCGLFLLQAAPFLMAATMIIYAGAIVVTFLFVVMLAKQEGASNADQRSREPFLAALAGCLLMAALLCVLQRTFNTGELDGIAEELQKIKAVKNEDEAKALLGDPKKAEENKRTLDVVKKLRAGLAGQRDEGVDDQIDRLQRFWMKGDVEQLKKSADDLLQTVQSRRAQLGTLALKDVPGKTNTPGHFSPGRLPANNVAALGRTLFTDYLIPVELAATLLLVATIGAIVIAGRRTEELR